jgi:DNA adenine methylase
MNKQSLDGIRTPISYYGGKQKMLKDLMPIIPKHRIYCEPFFGGGALFFEKPKSEVEIINDINGEVVNFYRVVKNKYPELQKEIRATLHSREVYNEAMIIYKNPRLFTDVQRAWALWTATSQGFSNKIGSWGFGKDPKTEKALANKREEFTKEYAERFETVQIENNDAVKVIERADTKDTFFYCDPPYIGSHMGHYSGYTENDFAELLKILSKIKGKFLLSSYPNELLAEYTKKFKWKTQKVEKLVAVTKNTNKTKTEVMTMNYDPAKVERVPFVDRTETNQIISLTERLEKLKIAA